MLPERLVVILAYFVVVHGDPAGKEQCPNIKTSLGSVRKRRHLTFPDNSNAVITISLAKAFQTHVPSGWMMVMDMDVNFPLPGANFTLAHARKKLHHKQKRDLWQRIESTIGIHNMNGNACVMRTICEAKAHLAPKGKSLVHDILRAIFSVPAIEKEFEEEMGASFEEVLDPKLCERIHECPLSLLQFILNLNRPR